MNGWMALAIGLGLFLAFAGLALAIVQAASACDQAMGWVDDEVEL